MYSFQDYKNLSDDITAIATSVWVTELKSRLGGVSLYKLPVRLSELGASHLDGYDEQKSKYWNDKFKGQPLRNDIKVKAIESVLPGSSLMLYHPLWFLLNISEPNNSDLFEIASNLSPKTYQRVVGEKDGKLYFKCLRTEIGFDNTLDALTVKLIHHHWQKLNCRNSKGEAFSDNLDSVETHKLFIRLFSVKYDDKFVGSLYRIISKRFSSNRFVAEPFTLPKNNLTVTNFPLSFGKVQSESEAENVIKTATQVINHVCSRFGIFNKKDRMKLFNYVSWRKIGCLLENVEVWDKSKSMEDVPYLFVYLAQIYFSNGNKLTEMNELDYDYYIRYVPSQAQTCSEENG